MKSSNTHKGAAILIIGFSAIFLIIAGRFIYIQSTAEIEGVNLNEWAEEVRTSSYSLDAKRGNIYDKNGMVLAYDRPTYKMYAIVDPSYSRSEDDPAHVTDPEKTASALAPILDMEQSEIEERIVEAQEAGRFQVEFGNKGRELSQDVKDQIEALKLSGINFDEEAKRYYPNGTFASHIIGFARTEEGHITGVTGVEKQMEEYLREKKGQISYERDKYGSKLLNPNEVLTEPDDGENVHLTIDQKIQTFLEDAMATVDEQYEPEKIMAAVLDADTGQVLALGNRPSYNPNDLGEVQNWYNDIISDSFEPGSTMKMFTWAAAIEEGVYNGDASFKSGSYEVSGTKIHDHKPEGWGEITYDEGFERSSNVAASILGYEKLGPEKFRDYLSEFHLDEKSGIDLPGEGAGKLLYKYPIEKVTTTFGQGSTTTPMQLLTAATAIANDGKMMQPYTLSKITSSETGEIIKEKKPEVIDEPISPETASRMRDLLKRVVSGEHGTGKPFELSDYSMGGKTGTAQIPKEGGGYLTGKENHIFSFLGMAPVEDPELIMYVAVKQPKLDVTETGSEPVSHIVKSVMENSLHYLNINPDQSTDTKVKELEMKDYAGKKTEKVKKELEEEFDNVTVVGKGKEVVKTIPEPGTKVLSDQRIIVITDEPAMPDITGWSLRDVQKLAEHFELQVETMGNGYVVKQNLEKGSKLNKGGYLVVELSPPQ
ncbi:penicillin-binding transpeptidase domain-containing protein [Halobacillus sp. Marseille-Q1614]|uniref:penicillin-binding transpeptidase domain-containing protein n=1 Tax=Halobacillus sp. Marseille-Q1614 TaxID=2709134 RepID=UPI00156E3790|nr:penicillin-binding transpeptidase domain-containing protein [Halobacillus sp. Marseille-Q1614]